MKRFRFSVLLFSLLATFCSVSFFSPSIKKVHRKHLNDADTGHYTIIIDKSDYELQVFDEDGWYATYPVVFGSKDLGDKMREGDKRTPNGSYKVLLKKIHKKWGPELLLNYPTPANQAMFKERKAKGLISANARIGDGIAIHGTRPDEEWTVDAEYSWTDGCISLKYSEMLDLYSYIPTGTSVTIRP
jgi:murein L,D-transpeptidase YafK